MEPTIQKATPEAIVVDLRKQVDAGLGDLVPPTEPAELYEPVRYILDSKGKRLRPILLLLTARIWGVSEEQAMPAGLALEVFHNFTLVHDDIMDHASERRGRPTVHVKWDESTAILAGDYLLALSYDLLARLERGDLSQVIRAYHRMVSRLCEGQTLDKVFEQRADVTVEDYFSMIYAKTGALIECSLELGGLISGAPPDDVDSLKSVGKHIGRAFQLQDDLLDLTAADERWGKRVGGDLVEGKKTFLLLRSLERAAGDDRRWFEAIIRNNGLPSSQIDEARDRMQALGVLDEARALVDHHSEEALRGIRSLPSGDATAALRWLIEAMRKRGH